jgi:hypothetical protein
MYFIIMRTPKNIDTDAQDDIIERIRNIVCSDDNSFTLYDIDNNIDIQNKIMAMIPEIRMHFYVHNFVAVSEGCKLKRPYMAIIRNLLERKYDILIGDYRDHLHNTRTRKYYIMQKKTT